MPYKDPERRRQAGRKWRLSHREQRAAYMRRYRKARSSGRPPGRPRSRDLRYRHLPVTAEWVDAVPTSLAAPSAEPTPTLSTTRAPIESPSNGPPTTAPREHDTLPPSPSAALLWEDTFGWGDTPDSPSSL